MPLRARDLFQESDGAKLFRDNIVFDQMAFGLHAYTVAGGLKNISAKGNAVFNNGASGICGTNVLIGGDAPVDNLTFDSNYVYKGSGTANGALWLGYGNSSVNSRVRGNMVGNTFLRLYNWSICLGGAHGLREPDQQRGTVDRHVGLGRLGRNDVQREPVVRERGARVQPRWPDLQPVEGHDGGAGYIHGEPADRTAGLRPTESI